MNSEASPEAQARDLERAALAHLRTALKKLDSAIAQATHPRKRGTLLGQRFALERRLQVVFPWYSQAGQDRWIDQVIFRGKRGGSFVEIGAYDGITGSNTVFFEKFRGWHGVLVEPSPHWAGLARTMRSSPCVEAAAGGVDGTARFLEITTGYTQMGGLIDSYDATLMGQVTADPRFDGREITVAVRPLADLLDDHGMRSVDYVSLDVEGAETDVLRTFPFDRFDIGVWSIENNTGHRGIAEIMRSADYAFAGWIGVDEIWAQPALLSS